MAKNKERQVAEKLYIELFRPQNEIAEELGLTEKTVGNWAREGNWKELRNARINNSNNRAETVKKVIAGLSESALELQQKIKDAEEVGDMPLALCLKKESTAIAQQVGMYQKALEKLEKNFKVSLSTYLEVMDDIFEALQTYEKELYIKTLDFQKYHLQNIAQKLG